MKATLIVLLTLVLGGAWLAANRYEIYDISATSCCAYSLTTVVFDRWTGRVETRTHPIKP